MWPSFISVSVSRPKAKQRLTREVGARAGNPPPALVLSLWVGLERRRGSLLAACALPWTQYDAKRAHSAAVSRYYEDRHQQPPTSFHQYVNKPIEYRCKCTSITNTVLSAVPGGMLKCKKKIKTKNKQTTYYFYDSQYSDFVIPK